MTLGRRCGSIRAWSPVLLPLLGALTQLNASATELPQSAPIAQPILGQAEALRVVGSEVLLRTQPSVTAPRRGALRRGAEVWAYRNLPDQSCPQGWLMVGPSAWACDAEGQFDGRIDNLGSPPNEPETLHFAQVGSEGAIGYTTIERVEQQLPDAELQPGFYVGVVEQRRVDGELYYRTTHRIWVPAEATNTRRLSLFEGKVLTREDTSPELLPYLSIGWVYRDNVRARKAPEGPLRGITLQRLTPLHVLATPVKRGKLLWFQTDAGWLSSSELRVPKTALAPSQDVDNERYLDIDTQTQTLVAYARGKPWFATMVSTGQGLDNNETATPKGEYRIWVKLLSSDMDNLEAPEASDEKSMASPYAVEAVPWVMYFKGGYGLHATYWHDQFGTARSHGCVNLSPKDAKRIFEYASPRLGPGWQAVHASDYDPATLVRVR